MKALKGPKGTEVNVTIMRRNKEIDYKIVRDKIPQYSVDVAYMVDAEIGYIKVNRFAATTFEEFHTSLKKLKDLGMKKLVLDLQGKSRGLYEYYASIWRTIFWGQGRNRSLLTGRRKSTIPMLHLRRAANLSKATSSSL